MKIQIKLAILMLAFSTSCADEGEKTHSSPDASWIDLTYPFDSTTVYWPNNICGFEHKEDFNGISEGGFYYSSFSFCTPEHGGTHMDAPVHFAKDRQTADSVPLESIIGNGIVIDVSDSSSKNRDYLVSVADIENWMKLHGPIPDKSIILFRTGYGKYYPDRKSYLGTDLKGDSAIPHLHFPGISTELATWLVTNKKAKAVGIDTPSIDYGQSKDFMSHRILLGANIPAFENVAALDKLPLKGFEIVALPMKIAGGSGAPLRIAAKINE